MKTKGIRCPNCGRLLKQIPKRKPLRYCNKKCYNKFLVKTGYFKKAMQKYFEKHPEARLKANQKAKEYDRAHKKPQPDRFCEECGNLLNTVQRRWCCKACKREGVKEYHRKYNKKWNKKNKLKKKISKFISK